MFLSKTIEYLLQRFKVGGKIKITNKIFGGFTMKNIYTMTPEEVKANAKIPLNICDHEVDMYWKVAIEVLETIEENNRKGKTTFMIVPYGLPLNGGIRAGVEIYHTLGRILKKKGLASGVGDEGGFAPNLSSDEEAIELLCIAIKEAGYDFDKVGIALDVASSEWFENGKYVLPKRNKTMSAPELIKYYEELTKRYPIISIEDGLAEDDFEGWVALTKALGSKIMLVGDDLFVTNVERLGEGIRLGIGNSILIKPNQIGTLSETLTVIALAKKSGYKVILSHRSGETTDTAISDISVAVGAEFIKSGAPCRGERVGKYHRLSEIIYS